MLDREMDDIKYMKAALKISRKGLGFTEPNPMVGAVVVKDGCLLSTGYHSQYGAPHAEQVALKYIEELGTTLYVTLEPCVHYGKTPPCAELILEKKVKRVVVAMEDPNPKVDGRGIQRLREQGVQVDVGLLKGLAQKTNRHYFTYMTQKRPYIALKAGVSIDCKLTDKFRKSQWITGEYLRQFSHSFRGEFMAIMAGANTIVDDNPLLTIRQSAWDQKKLIRVVLDSQNRLDPSLNVFQDQKRFPLFLFSSKQAENQKAKVENHFFINPSPSGGGLDLNEVLETLYRKDVSSVLVEGGGALFDSFLTSKLYDEIVFSVADKLIGGQDSIQFFSSGTAISEPIELKSREIIPLETGYIVRGYRETW